MEQIGRYKVEYRLGRGGMAEVWLAHHPTLNRQVAIKIVHSFLQSDDGSDQRFLQEAQLVAALRHPNIVQLYDFDLVDGQPFMVMEYLSGGTLHDLLRTQRDREQLLPISETVRLFDGITSALAYAHTQGAIHRDLKPANILLTDSGDPVISDFGIAKLLSSGAQLSMTGAAIGTPTYMSPEQAAGQPVDKRSDIYALGVMLFEMLTGKVPFSADSPTALLAQHVHTPPPNLRQLNPNIPLAIEQVVRRALAKRPEQRFANALQLGAALQPDSAAAADSGWQTDAVTVIETDIAVDLAPGSVNITHLSALSQQAQVTASALALALCPLRSAQIATVINESEETVLIALDALWQAGLIGQDDAQQAYYLVDKNLQRKVVERLNPAQASLLHRKCAAALLQGVGSAESYDLQQAVARHYQQAGLSAQAVMHYAKAGEIAVANDVRAQSLTAFEHAVTILEANETVQVARNLIYFRLAQILHQQGGWQTDKVGQLLESARRYSEDGADELPEITLCQWFHHITRGDLENAYLFAQQFWHLAQETRDFPVAHLVVATTLHQVGRFAQAAVHYKRGLANTHAIDPHGLARYFAMDVRGLLGLGAYYTAREQEDIAAADRFLRTASRFHTE